jgi:cobalamin biosynthesis protein CobT
MVGSIDISLFDNKVELDSSSGMTHKEYDVVEKDFENECDYDEGDYDEDEIEYEDSVDEEVENDVNEEVENDGNEDSENEDSENDGNDSGNEEVENDSVNEDSENDVNEDSENDSVNEDSEDDEVNESDNDSVYSLINKLKLVKLRVSIREQEYILMKYEMNMCGLCMKQDMDELCYLDQHMKTMSPVIFKTSLFYKKNFDIIESKKKDTLINKFSRVVLYVNLINIIANIVSNCY